MRFQVLPEIPEAPTADSAGIPELDSRDSLGLAELRNLGNLTRISVTSVTARLRTAGPKPQIYTIVPPPEGLSIKNLQVDFLRNAGLGQCLGPWRSLLVGGDSAADFLCY